MVVKRTSQAHQTPQITRPQIMPVTRLAAPNTRPTSVIEAAKPSYRKSFFTR